MVGEFVRCFVGAGGEDSFDVVRGHSSFDHLAVEVGVGTELDDFVEEVADDHDHGGSEKNDADQGVRIE